MYCRSAVEPSFNISSCDTQLLHSQQNNGLQFQFTPHNPITECYQELSFNNHQFSTCSTDSVPSLSIDLAAQSDSSSLAEDALEFYLPPRNMYQHEDLITVSAKLPLVPSYPTMTASANNEDLFKNFLVSSVNCNESRTEDRWTNAVGTASLSSCFFQHYPPSNLEPIHSNTAEWQPSPSNMHSFSSENADVSRHALKTTMKSKEDVICPFQSSALSTIRTIRMLKNADNYDDMDDLEEDSRRTPKGWRGIGGVTDLYRCLPENLKDSLSSIKVPENIEKRKFLTVREMLTIKNKLAKGTKAYNLLQDQQSYNPFGSHSMLKDEILIVKSSLSGNIASSISERPCSEKSICNNQELFNLATGLNVSRKQPNETLKPQYPLTVEPKTITHKDDYNRPLQFEFSSLQIGLNVLFAAKENESFDQISCLKVMFTAQKFVYEFELTPRISFADDGQVLVTRIVSVEVPFASVIGLSCDSEKLLQLLVAFPPLGFVGYRTYCPLSDQSQRSERMVEIKIGELLANPTVHRLVLMRSEDARELKYHLSNFNVRFSNLLSNPQPAVETIYCT